MSDPRLFESEQDAAEDRRRAARVRALSQPRCGCCGRFHGKAGLTFGSVCAKCMEDTRPAIAHKVDQARRWWLATKAA